MRAVSSYEKTFVIGYANGYFHYSAPKEVYNNGGYESVECMFAPEWEEIYVNAVKTVIEEVCGKKVGKLTDFLLSMLRFEIATWYHRI